MAETKEEKAEARTVSLFNRGPRTFDLGLSVGQDGKASPRRHLPGASHAYTPTEAAKMSTYKDLVDLSKLPGQVDTKKLAGENAKLLAENASLKEQLAALAPKEEPVKDPKKKSS